MTRRTDLLKIRLETDGAGKVKASLVGVGDDVQKLDEKGKHANETYQTLKEGIIAIGSAAVLNSIKDTVVEFERMNASLVTVTGSQQAATREMEKITNFTATTPFQLAEVTEAYIKLKALGLDPSEEALRSYGNTASAMGKSLDQMVEAIADAVTGEFERLKEFGIKANAQGDQVKFTFQGVTTTVNKNAKDIEHYLRRIGQVQFAGAMERQMDTLGGAISNMHDSITLLEAALGEAGLSGMIRSGSGLVRDFATSLREAIQPSDDLAAKFDDMSAAGKVFLSVFTGIRNMAEEAAKHMKGGNPDLFGLSTDTLIQKGKKAEDQLMLIRQQIKEIQDKDLTHSPFAGPQYQAMLEQLKKEEAALEAEKKQIDAAYQFRQGLIDRSKGNLPSGSGSNNSGQDGAASATNNHTKAVQKLIDKLVEQGQTLGMNEVELAKYKARQAGASEAEIAHIGELAKVSYEYEQEKNAIEAAHKEQEKHDKKLRDEAKKAYEETRTPLEQYNAELAKNKELLDKGLISQDTYNRELVKAKKDMEDLQKKSTSEFDDIKRAVQDFGGNARQAIKDFVNGAKVDVADLGKTIIETFENILIQRALIDPLEKGFNGILDGILGGKSGGGILSSFFGNANGGINPANALPGFGAKPFGFASGGSFMIPGTGGTDSKRIIFDGTPGERVTVETPDQQRRAGGTTVQGPLIVVQGNADERTLAKMQQWAINDFGPMLSAATKKDTLRTLSRPGFA